MTTWRDFKAQCEAHGITDETDVRYIDWHAGDPVKVTYPNAPDDLLIAWVE